MTILHPLLGDVDVRKSLERVAYSSIAAAGLITPFQKEPEGSADMGSQELAGAIWQHACRIFTFAVPELSVTWCGPIPVIRAALRSEDPVERRLELNKSGKFAVLETALDGTTIVRKGSQRFRVNAAWRPGLIAELIHFGALQPDEEGRPVNVEVDVAFPRQQEALAFVGHVPHWSTGTDFTWSPRTSRPKTGSDAATRAAREAEPTVRKIDAPLG